MWDSNERMFMKTSLNIFKTATQMQGIMFTNSQHVLEAEARHSKMAQNQDNLCVLCLPFFHFNQDTHTLRELCCRWGTFPRLENKSYQNMSNWNEKWLSHCESLTILWPNCVTLHMPDCKSDLGARLKKEAAVLQESNMFRESKTLAPQELEWVCHCA